MERSRKSLRTSSADFRPVSEDVSDTVDTVVAEEADSAEDVVDGISLAKEDLAWDVWLLGADEDGDELSEGEFVMQSNDTFFPLPTLRAATHKSARSSRLMRVTPFGLLEESLLLL